MSDKNSTQDTPPTIDDAEGDDTSSIYDNIDDASADEQDVDDKYEDRTYEKETEKRPTHVDSNKDTTLLIFKIPFYWRIPKMQNYIKEITKTENIIEGIKGITMGKKFDINEKDTGACLVKFYNAEICNLAFEEWNTESQSKEFSVIRPSDTILMEYKLRKRCVPIHSNEKPPPKRKKNYNLLIENVNETYGLSNEFLRGLRIKLPLSPGIYISNLDHNVDEAKIREVFSLAGQIVRSVVVKKGKCFAKVLYDHPVEAVQAISMFNQQKLNDKPMIVHMDFKQSIGLPDGLEDLGPGLGLNGEPLRGVRNRIELEPFKQLLKNIDTTKSFGAPKISKKSVTPFVQSVEANAPMAFQAPMGLPMVPQTAMVPMTAQNQMSMSDPKQMMNLFGATSTMNPFNMSALQNTQMLQNLSQQSPANIQQLVNTLLQNSMAAGAVAPNSNTSNNEWVNVPTQNENKQTYSGMVNYNNSYGSNQSIDNGQKNYNDFTKYGGSQRSESNRDEARFSTQTSDMLIFKNLPKTVNVQKLKGKMQEVGEVKMADITGPGRAIVRFATTADAARCIKLFDKSKVDGQIISVQYL